MASWQCETLGDSHVKETPVDVVNQQKHNFVKIQIHKFICWTSQILYILKCNLLHKFYYNCFFVFCSSHRFCPLCMCVCLYVCVRARVLLVTLFNYSHSPTQQGPRAQQQQQQKKTTRMDFDANTSCSLTAAVAATNWACLRLQQVGKA